MNFSVLPSQLRQVLSARQSSEVPEENQDHFAVPEVLQGHEPAVGIGQGEVRRSWALKQAGQTASPSLTLFALEDGLSGGFDGVGAQAVPGYQLLGLP